MTQSQTDNSVPVPTDDQALLARLRRGELEAGQELMERYHQPLMRYLQRLIGNESIAADLLQRTWADILDNLTRFDARLIGAFKVWIFRIATNKASDYLHGASRDQTPINDGQPSDPAQSTDQAQSARWPAIGLDGVYDSQLPAAIGHLPQICKQVLLLRYYAKMKFVEIADVLGCSLDTVLQRMFYALQKLGQMKD
ncbi:MAG: sigma-70 family RNA polymerase sigma factor [Phycisphaerales bacterium]|nr:sigma-70 family RNA polymerase sigma factor [Phycisphaerales bacterium]